MIKDKKLSTGQICPVEFLYKDEFYIRVFTCFIIFFASFFTSFENSLSSPKTFLNFLLLIALKVSSFTLQ